MPTDDRRQTSVRHRVSRREFLRRVGWGAAATTALTAGAGRSRASADSTYPDWVAPSPKPAKRGGALTRASAWDPPVLDPRLTNSVGLFQIATLTSNRLLRYPFADEAQGSADLTLRGDLAEMWEGSPDFQTWTF